MNAVGELLRRVRKGGARRGQSVRLVAMGRARTFDAWDLGDDTFVFERGVAHRLGARPSALVVPKRALGRRARGWVFTLTTGNHAVAALPLLDGRLWKIARLPSARRSATLLNEIVCANAVGGALELSQRDVPTARLVEADRWLREKAGLGLADVVMLERNDATLEHFRRLGQEWRVKPLAWTDAEMRAELAASRKRIATRLKYYHSAKGVHFLSYAAFAAMAELAESEPEELLRELRELVGVFEGNECSFARMPKHRGHHEIEFFGLHRGVAVERIVPALETLTEDIVLGRTDGARVAARLRKIAALYASLLTRPELADEQSGAFVSSLYMFVTGEIYAVVGEGATPAFDDRRTALPGATFLEGRPVLHPGADARTEVLLSNLRGMMSKDERVEYANVYELRSGDSDAPLGCGATREVVYKTDRRPLPCSVVEKRLAHVERGYCGYFLARVGTLRALGVGLSSYYQLLKQRAGLRNRRGEYYIRRRCEGEPMESIPATYFRRADGGADEDREVVLALAALMGDAAAQNMAMKKYDPATKTPLFGVGKEIYEFDYDLAREQVVPKRVTTCSIRGSFGWPDLEETDENLARVADFYLGHYAAALADYGTRHRVGTDALVARFLEGFSYRTRAMEWQMSVMRDHFETFRPELPARYGFDRKWRFVMWSLERQARRLPAIGRLFAEKVSARAVGAT